MATLVRAVYWAIRYTTRSTSTAQAGSGQLSMVHPSCSQKYATFSTFWVKRGMYVVAGAGAGGGGRLKAGGVEEQHGRVDVAHTQAPGAHTRVRQSSFLVSYCFFFLALIGHRGSLYDWQYVGPEILVGSVANKRLEIY